MSHRSLTTFVDVVISLAQFIDTKNSEGSTRRQGAGNGNKTNIQAGNDNVPGRLKDQLLKWINHMFDQLFVVSVVGASPGQQVSDAEIERHLVVFDFLGRARSFGLHRNDAGSKSNRDLPDAIVCLATYCLSISSTLQLITTSEVNIIIKLLWEATPVTLTYSNLITRIFNKNPGIAPPFSTPTLAECKQTLQKQALSLRSQHLLWLEASLWSCALRHIEQLDGKPGVFRGSAEEVKEFREELIDSVDEAERQCFGPGEPWKDLVDTERTRVTKNHEPRGCALRTNQRNSTDVRSHTDTELNDFRGGWEWEGTVGCWARQSDCASPTAKRVKLGHDQPVRISSSSKRLSANIFSNAISQYSPSLAKKSTASGISPRSSVKFRSPSQHTVCESQRKDLTSLLNMSGSLSDEQNDSHRLDPRPGSSPLIGRTRAPSSISGFSSILADALTNRKVLHPKPDAVKLETPNHDAAQIMSPIPLLLQSPLDNSVRLQSSPTHLDSLDLSQVLPSDDALDLFMYPDSNLSPASHGISGHWVFE